MRAWYRVDDGRNRSMVEYRRVMRVGFCVMLLALGSCRAPEAARGADAAAGSAADGKLLLQSFLCELPPVASTACERATSFAEWKSLRGRLGGEVAALPDDWCSFAGDAVIVVVTAAAAVRPGFDCTIGSEEGVDVLTLAQQGLPSGPAGSWAFVMRVACRPAQLAVVLRRNGPGGETAEQTLRVFPAQ
ncbi:MAG TPA: hypothetical protein VF384_13150 [Planctomycetota bacterium]